MTQKILEANSLIFSKEKLFNFRTETIRIVREFAANIPLGISEEEGRNLLEDHFKKFGVEKFWHPTKFRIGKNTTKSFKDISEPGVTLSVEDIFFIDIGPIYDGHEADYGETFYRGLKFQNLSRASIDIFLKTAKIWKNENLTGFALYERASKLAAEKGLILNHKMAGHRIGDFPHHVHYRGPLNEIDFHPIENAWVLEIHLIDESSGFGSFFEDILIGD